MDVVPPDAADLSGYRLVLAPGLMRLSGALRAALARFDGLAVLGPRTGTKGEELAIAVPLGPDVEGLDAAVTLAESLPPGATIPLATGGFQKWFEHLEGSAAVLLATADGRPAVMGGRVRYLAGWPDDEGYDALLRGWCREAGVPTLDLPRDIRVRDAGPWRFAFNHGPEPVGWEGATLPPAGVTWRRA